MTDQMTTTRLQLRPLCQSDAADIANQANDHAVTKWLTQLPYPYTKSDAKDFIARQVTGRTYRICLGAKVIGCIGTSGEFGYWIGRAYWGLGYATEAAIAVVSRHFSQNISDLVSGHALGNLRSRNVLLKLGFHDTSIVTRKHKITGVVRQQQMMMLTRQDWERAR